MTNFTKSLMMLLVSLSLIQCSSGGQKKTADTFHEAAFFDQNRAPASMTPQEITDDKIDPVYMRTQADYHYTLAESYSLAGDHKKAIEELKHTLIYDNKSSMIYMRLAAENVKVGLLSEAIKNAEAAVSADPKSLDAKVLLGGLYSMLRMYKEALVQYQEVLKLEPGNSEAQLYIGAVYAEQKKYSEAVKHFEALAKNPEFKTPHLAYYYVGKIYVEGKLDNYQKMAEQNYKKSLEIMPNFADAVVALGVMQTNSERKIEAKKLYESYQKKHGPDAIVAENLAQLYLENEEYDEAYKQFEIVESANKGNLNIMVKMALILIEKKSFSQAIMKLEEILTQVPDSDKIRFYLAAVYEENKDSDSAIRHFLKIPSISNFYPEAVVHAAYLNKIAGKFDEAEKILTEAMKNRDDIPEFYTLYAALLDDKKEYKKALVLLTEGTKKFPEHAQLRFFLGSMHDRVGDTEKTIVEMKKVIELDDQHTQALNFLAYTYADKGYSLTEAENLIQRALKKNPADGYFLDTLGWIYFKQGKVKQAIQALEAAYNRIPSESIIAEHLGDAYYKHQMPDKARSMYLRAVENETNQEKQSEIRAKITAIDVQVKSNRRPASSQFANPAQN